MAHPADPTREKKSPTTLVVAGMLFLLLMGFFWSADASFRYIFFAAAVSCFGFALSRSGFSLRSRVVDEFRDDVRTITRKQSPSGSYRNPQHHSPKKDPKVIVFVSFFIGIIFLVIVSAVAVLSDEVSADARSKALTFYNESNWDSAKYYYRSALRDDPDDLESIRGLGSTFMLLQEYDSAEVYFARFVEINPYDEGAWYSYALTSFNKGDFDKTKSTLNRLVDYSPGYTYGLMLYGDIYYQQERYDSAISWYERAYATGTEDPQLCHVMAYIYDTQGETQSAVRFYQETLQYDSSRTDIYRRLGELIPGPEGEEYRALFARYGAGQ